MTSAGETRSRVQTKRLVLALVDATGFARASRGRAPADVFEGLRGLHAKISAAAAPAGGTVVKVLGDAVLLVFPEARAAEAVGALRALAGVSLDDVPFFGPESVLQVKAHVGEVAWGELGPPGDERPDVAGEAVNELFLLPGGDRVFSDALSTLVPGGE